MSSEINQFQIIRYVIYLENSSDQFSWKYQNTIFIMFVQSEDWSSFNWKTVFNWHFVRIIFIKKWYNKDFITQKEGYRCSFLWCLTRIFFLSYIGNSLLTKYRINGTIEILYSFIVPIPYWTVAFLEISIQSLSQDLETGCPKLPILKFWGVQIFKGDHNILRFQP